MVRTKQQEHAELENKITAWLAAGNEIKRYEMGATSSEIGMTHDAWERRYLEAQKNKPAPKPKIIRAPSVKDLTGMRFGHLVAIRVQRHDKTGRSVWVCQCDCGGISKPIQPFVLLNGERSSCSPKCPFRNRARK